MPIPWVGKIIKLTGPTLTGGEENLIMNKALYLRSETCTLPCDREQNITKLILIRTFSLLEYGQKHSLSFDNNWCKHQQGLFLFHQRPGSEKKYKEDLKL